MNVLPPVNYTEREVSNAVNQLIAGRSNAVGRVTAAAMTTSTVVNVPNGNRNAIVVLAPENAAAATAGQTGAVYAVMTSATQFTIEHPSLSQPASWGYAVIGGG
ncbi:MAG: hypothetical protein AAGF32_10835 [Pseudomonadota bacterium]